MKRKKFISSAIAAIPVISLLPELIMAGEKTTHHAPAKPFVVKSGGSRFNKPMKYKGVHPNDIIISRQDTGNAMSVFAYTGFARIGPSLHLHQDQDEIFYIVEGRYRFVAGNETMELEPGDTIFLPRKIAHSWIQLTDRGRLLYMAQPAGTLEDFFIEMNNLKGALSESEAKAIHRKHGMELIGPSLTL